MTFKTGFYFLLVFLYKTTQKCIVKRNILLTFQCPVLQRLTLDPVMVCGVLSLLIIEGNWPLPHPLCYFFMHVSYWILQKGASFVTMNITLRKYQMKNGEGTGYLPLSSVQLLNRKHVLLQIIIIIIYYNFATKTCFLLYMYNILYILHAHWLK